jgi:hypothetical protein
MSKKVRVTKEKLYSMEKKRRRASGIMKKVSGQLKIIEKQKGKREKKETATVPTWLHRERCEAS